MQFKLSSRDSMIAAVLGIIAVAALIVVVGIVPQFKQIGVIDAEMQGVRAQTNEYRNLLSRRQNAKDSSAQTQAEILALANKMPDSPEMPSLIIELQDTANEAGLTFRSLKPQLPVSDGAFSRIKLDMVVLGQWSDIIEYLRRLSKLERQVRIVNSEVLAADPVPGQTENDELAMKITIEAYTLATTNSATAPPPPAPAQ